MYTSIIMDSYRSSDIRTMRCFCLFVCFHNLNKVSFHPIVFYCISFCALLLCCNGFRISCAFIASFHFTSIVSFYIICFHNLNKVLFYHIIFCCIFFCFLLLSSPLLFSSLLFSSLFYSFCARLREICGL